MSTGPPTISKESNTVAAAIPAIVPLVENSPPFGEFKRFFFMLVTSQSH